MSRERARHDPSNELHAAPEREGRRAHRNGGGGTALLAAVQILVWNPQAAVPGVGLDQIYADVAATGESMAAGMVIAFLAVGPLLAIALLVGAWRRPEGRASVVGVPFLVLLALGAPAYFSAAVAGHGPGRHVLR